MFDQSGNQQAAHAAIPVQKRMYRFELRMQQSDADQRRELCVFSMDKLLEIG